MGFIWWEIREEGGGDMSSTFGNVGGGGESISDVPPPHFFKWK